MTCYISENRHPSIFLAHVPHTATTVAGRDEAQRRGMEGHGGALGALARHGPRRDGADRRPDGLGVHDREDDPRADDREGPDPPPDPRARRLVRAARDAPHRAPLRRALAPGQRVRGRVRDAAPAPRLRRETVAPGTPPPRLPAQRGRPPPRGGSMISSWWNWMAAMSVQIVVVVIVVAILERLLARRAHPRLAAGVWLVALAKLGLPPTLESPLGLGVDLAPFPSGVATAAFWIWLAGAAAFGALALRRQVRLRRELLGDSTEPAAPVLQAAREAARRLGLRRAPPIRVLPGLSVPCVVGFFRPVVLVPDGPANGHALLHEIAHIRRRDPLASLAPLVAQIVYWFHPAAWVIRSRLETLREVGCDAAVARALGVRAPGYRRTLLDFARRLLRSPAPGATAFYFGRSRLVERLEWLSPRAPRRPAARFFSPIAAGLVLAACVPLARSAPPPFVWPTLDQAQGCLQRRFIVLEAMSHQP